MPAALFQVQLFVKMNLIKSVFLYPPDCILTNVMKFRSQYSVFWYDHDLRASNVRERTITLRIRYQCNWVIIDPLVVANSD